MFSGIVEEMGVVEGIRSLKNLSILKVHAKKAIKGAKLGASIAVNGVCLTVSGINKNVLSFDVMKESLDKTTLGELRKGRKVNLERALKANGRIDGHFVTGHVDGACTVKEVLKRENYIEIRVSMAKDLARYIAPKGSVCLDGVSLTIGKSNKKDFSVYLIPFTGKTTTLGGLKKGDKINVETDILAKYILN